MHPDGLFRCLIQMVHLDVLSRCFIWKMHPDDPFRCLIQMLHLGVVRFFISSMHPGDLLIK